MTQDAYATDERTIEKLVEPILKDQAAVSYARQLPRQDADLFEAVPRLFNYPAESNIRSIEDIPKYGVYTFFCSNSCAAYRNNVLDEIGGFESVLTNEDYFAVAKILQKGYKIAYVAEAMVEHSHEYTLIEEFKRYFDTGYVRSERRWITKLVGHAESRGMQLFIMTLKELKRENILLLPKAFFVFFARWLGFRLGFLSIGMPSWFKKILSAQRYYWDSKYYRV